MSDAYLVLFLHDGHVVSASIYSEPADQLTRPLNSPLLAVTAARAYGSTYEKARAEVLRAVSNAVSYKWIVPFLIANGERFET